MSVPMTSRFGTLRRSRPALIAALTLTAVLTCAPAVPAAAHSKLTTSTPANGAVLTTTPATFAFSFDQTLQPVPSWDAVLVTGPDGSRHPAHSVHIERDTLFASCEDFGAAGVYTV